jgi:hypothetical protein
VHCIAFTRWSDVNTNVTVFGLQTVEDVDLESAIQMTEVV